jgi:hypothetical protein
MGNTLTIRVEDSRSRSGGTQKILRGTAWWTAIGKVRRKYPETRNDVTEGKWSRRIKIRCADSRLQTADRRQGDHETPFIKVLILCMYIRDINVHNNGNGDSTSMAIPMTGLPPVERRGEATPSSRLWDSGTAQFPLPSWFKPFAGP